MMEGSPGPLLSTEVVEALTLPPDLEEMVERRIGAPREPIETAEHVRLELSDILIEGRANVLRKLAAEEKPKVRAVLVEVDELIQAMFERFAPERWAEELAKAEAAEAEAAEIAAAAERDKEKDKVAEVMAKAMMDDITGRSWERSEQGAKDLWTRRARLALDAYSELEHECADTEVGQS